MRTRYLACVLLLALVVATVPALAADDAAARLQEAQAQFTAHQFARAEGTAREALATGEARSAILIGAAEVVILCKLSQGDFDGAKQAAQGLQGQIADAAAQGYLNDRIAGILANKAAYETAVADLQQTVASRPKDDVGAGAAYKLGVVNAFWGRMQEAQAAFQRVVDDFRGSDRALAARLALGGLYEQAADNAKAEEEYNTIVSADPSSLYAAQAVQRISVLHWMARDTLGAREEMEAIVQAHPQTEAGTAALYAQADIALAEQKIELARATYEQAAQSKKDTTAAIAAARAAAVQDAPAIQAARDLVNEALALSEADRYDEAMAKYVEAIRIAPSGATPWLEAHEGAAEIATERERYDEAAAHYRAIIDACTGKAPSAFGGTNWSGLARYGLGQTLMTQGKCDLAAKEFERMIADNVDSVWTRGVFLPLADCYTVLGDIDRSIAALNTAISRYPRTPTAAEAQYAIGTLLNVRLRRIEEAKQAYQRVLTDYADVKGCEPWRAFARDRLREVEAPDGDEKPR